MKTSISLWLALLLGVGCTFDADHRCGPHQTIYGNDDRCVCESGYALSGNVCLACGEHEESGSSGCACVEGYARGAESGVCEALDAGAGEACSGDDDCKDAKFPHCQPSDFGGYCTSLDCHDSSDCASGFACESSAEPSYCERPPVGLGKTCQSADDCADGEATFCDTFQSHTCLVQDCTLSPNDCFGGWVCTDLTALGLPLNLCVPEGAL